MIRKRPLEATEQVDEVLSHTRPYGIADAMTLLLDRIRTRTEQQEREEVAAEVKGAIGRSGLSRTEFAAHIGTSASRLSTYVARSSHPSATLLLRMRRVAEQRAPQQGCRRRV